LLSQTEPEESLTTRSQLEEELDFDFFSLSSEFNMRPQNPAFSAAAFSSGVLKWGIAFAIRPHCN